MAKNSIEAYGASGKTNLLFFNPEVLTLVVDEASPLFDKRVHLPVDEDLARNIDYQGVLEPIAVQKNPETGAVEVVVGRQRTKAARLANEWRKARGVAPVQIPAFVHKGDRRNALDVIISENELRQADTPIGRAEKMRRLMSIGRGEAEIAVIYGCKPATVRSMLALLECCADVQNAVESGKIGLTHAKQLADLSPVEQRAKVVELTAAGEGAKPHERARKQRQVLGDTQPRMKTRKQILAELEIDPTGERAKALRWVLGVDEKMALPGLSEAKAAMQAFDREAA
ncbi:ParB N-terminal domain-containing protein [Paraburkholderia bryophila]|uniref:ParB/RepB/Spo0J family partition protein n=1 Tax=Paraburkholderia bryophila TaxID=420952 RepID=UPI00234BD085|nr:ParB N-terminal domain-containing protein [Paraburkholderia bryophila]WCM21395.1 ParB N-terminal domain-containing protein [Paraburkholderia bryophila]